MKLDSDIQVIECSNGYLSETLILHTVTYVTLPIKMNDNGISFAFQAIKIPYAHPTKLCCGVFCEFLGGFLGIFGKR